jgi:hypothetical protein
VLISTNTVGGHFSILKKASTVYTPCRKTALASYLSEFDFRYNSREIRDGERSRLGIKRVDDKRLMYRNSSRASSLKK